MREIIEKRTLNRKVFRLDNGRTMVRLSRTPFHYLKNGRLIDIDMTPERNRGHYLFYKSPFRLRVLDVVPCYRYESKNGYVEVELARVGDYPTIKKQAIEDNGRFFWNDIGNYTDCIIRPWRKGCAAYIILHSQEAPRSWVWKTKGDQSLIRGATGHDAKGQLLELIEDREGGEIRIEWTGRVTSQRFLRDKKNKQKWHENVEYPITIDPTVNESITANNDDGFTLGTAQYLGNTANLAGFYATQPVYAGLRFQTIAVPQGVSITSATLTIDMLSINGSPSAVVVGNDSDDAAAWTSIAINAITPTTASINITPTSTGTYGIGVTGIVQEIIDRTGWSSSNNLAIVINDAAGSGLNLFQFAALEHATREEAQLDIEYSSAVTFKQNIVFY